MAALKRLAAEHRFEVLWISLTRRSAVKRRARRVAIDLGFRVLDVGSVIERYRKEHGYRSYRHSPLVLSPDNIHPSALAHRLAAETLLAYLRAEALLPVPRQLRQPPGAA